MKERKLTLLIALSSIILSITLVFVLPVNANQSETPTDVIITKTDVVTKTEVSSVVSKIEEKPVSKTEEKKEVPSKVEEKKDTPSKSEVSSVVKKPAAAGKYPEAQLVWNTLKDAGLNDYVCAGIMGNLMAEVGGQTLDLSRWEYYSQGSHYGIAQWSSGRKNKMFKLFGSDLEAQAKFIVYELKSEMNTYGYKYQSGFGYEEFINMTDYREVALAFAMCYERCSSRYYNVRKTNAEKAYNYFVG